VDQVEKTAYDRVVASVIVGANDNNIVTTSTSTSTGTGRVVVGTEGNSVSEHGGGDIDNSVVRHPRAYSDTTSAYTHSSSGITSSEDNLLSTNNSFQSEPSTHLTLGQDKMKNES
jgi:hypothetical protein